MKASSPKIAVALILLLSLLLPTVSCGRSATPAVTIDPEEISSLPGSADQTAAPDAGETTSVLPDDPLAPAIPEKKTVTVTENYLPAAFRTGMEEALAAGGSEWKAYNLSYAPFAIMDVVTISGCTLRSISIPVHTVKGTDADGNFLFTLGVYRNSAYGLKVAAKRTYPLRISAAQYGLEANSSPMRFITVDLTDLGIVLTEGETLAFSAKDDTLLPASIGIVSGGPVRDLLLAQFPEICGFFQKVGTLEMGGPNASSLLFDFTWDKVYRQSELDARETLPGIIERLREQFEGKYLSVLGDSISTFDGISNNPSYNATISRNEVHYKPYARAGVQIWQNTYWGRLIADLGMNLCVDNAWGSSRVYGRESGNDSVGYLGYTDAAPYRAQQLDNDNGTPGDPSDDISPDVILFFMGINDLQNRSPFGSLWHLLAANVNATDDERRELIRKWFADVLAKTDNGAEVIRDDKIVCDDFDQNYALTLYRMTQAYPDAEIYCLNLMYTRDTRFDVELARQYNAVISALADYFGATTVDQAQYGPMQPDTAHAYSVDGAPNLVAVHPNANAFIKMERLILSAMAEKER